jgi:hypothetical protein
MLDQGRTVCYGACAPECSKPAGLQSVVIVDDTYPLPVSRSQAGVPVRNHALVPLMTNDPDATNLARLLSRSVGRTIVGDDYFVIVANLFANRIEQCLDSTRPVVRRYRNRQRDLTC